MLYERDQSLWTSFVKRQYPSLGKLEGCSFEELRHRICVETAKLYRQRGALLAARARELQMFWDAINDRWMLALARILEIDWAPFPGIFPAHVGLSPICPRSLIECSFSVPYFLSWKDVVRVSAHETAHFFYFGRIHCFAPGISEEELNYPHRPWLLSEILVPIILNDPRAVQVIGETPITSYVCNEALSADFAKIYGRRMTEGLSFEKFYHLVSELELRSEDIAPQFRVVLDQPREYQDV